MSFTTGALIVVVLVLGYCCWTSYKAGCLHGIHGIIADTLGAADEANATAEAMATGAVRGGYGIRRNPLPLNLPPGR